MAHATYWIRRDGETVAGPLYTLEFHDIEGAEVLELLPLAEYRLPNYVKPGTVAHEQHMRARRASSGAAHRVRALADGIHEYASSIGPDGDGYSGPLVADLLHALVGLLSADTGGWDGATVDSWARYVAEFIGETID